ncbi:MAG: hypothetical protein QF785_13135, partial [Phycisphaeraceae bacterium]|nr:hypothetical protein [Phycisphaeraceae bacterium]
KGGDLRASVKRIHQHGIVIGGSFIMGLDSDDSGVGRRIADAANHYGVDLLNPVFLTPLPGTRLWEKMQKQQRIAADRFPDEWQYYTLGFPVARYRNLSWHQLLTEMDDCWRMFYSPWRMLRRIASSLGQRRSPLTMIVGNLSYRRNYRAERRSGRTLDLTRGAVWRRGALS